MSKMRFMSVQFVPYLQQNLWYKYGKNANDMAKYLEKKLKEINIETIEKVEANIVFAKLPVNIVQPLHDFSFFFIINREQGICRFVTSFDIT